MQVRWQKVNDNGPLMHPAASSFVTSDVVADDDEVSPPLQEYDVWSYSILEKDKKDKFG